MPIVFPTFHRLIRCTQNLNNLDASHLPVNPCQPKIRQHREAERQYARDAKALEPVAFRRLSPRSRHLLEQAEFQARDRDNNHVGTEHIMLAISDLLWIWACEC